MATSRPLPGLAAAAAALLAAYGSGASQSAASPPDRYALTLSVVRLSAPGAFPIRRDGRRSWMAPGAARGDLLYVSDGGTADVYVFSYPSGKLVGTLTGFVSPSGMCVDKKGDVWISNGVGFDVLEYAHGGTVPIATLTQPNEITTDCSIDPTTGNLAVVNYCKLNDGNICLNSPGSVAIYKRAKGQPTLYSDYPPILTMYFGSYDNAGNFFVDGTTAANLFQLAELPNGSDRFTNFTLNRVVYFPGGVQWDGKYLAVGDQEAGNKITSSIHQVRIKGSKASVVGTTAIVTSVDVGAFWLEGSTLIGPEVRLPTANSDARLWNYPAGGKPTKAISGAGFYLPSGAVVSLKH